MRGKNKSINNISINNIKKIVDMFVDNGVELISLLGGEPFLHPDIIEILTYLESKRVHYTVTTNGINLTEEILKNICNFKYIKIVFSLYSLDEKNCEYMGISNNLITEKIILSKLYNLHIGVNTVLVSQNFNDIERIFLFCEKYQLDRYSIAIFNDKNSNIDHISIYEALNIYFKIRNKYSNVSKLDFAIEGCMIYSALYSKENLEMNEFQRITSGCQAAQSNLDITSDGKVYPCILIDDVCVKNVFDKSYYEIWDSDIYNSVRKYKVNNKICNECSYNIFCNGGCFANKKIMNGNFEKEIDRKCYRL